MYYFMCNISIIGATLDTCNVVYTIPQQGARAGPMTDTDIWKRELQTTI